MKNDLTIIVIGTVEEVRTALGLDRSDEHLKDYKWHQFVTAPYRRHPCQDSSIVPADQDTIQKPNTTPEEFSFATPVKNVSGCSYRAIGATC